MMKNHLQSIRPFQGSFREKLFLVLILLLLMSGVMSLSAQNAGDFSLSKNQSVCGFDFRHKEFQLKRPTINEPTKESLILRNKMDLNGRVIQDYVGQQVSFWTWDFLQNDIDRISATCKAVGEKCYVYVANTQVLDPGVVETIKDEFDGHIFPTNRAHFGSEWSPGIDGDEKITLLIYDIKDDYQGPGSSYIGGYFDPWDETSYDYSNRREMLYLDAYPAEAGSESFYATLAHEYQHLIHFNQDANEETWINEGCAEYAGFICGYEVRTPDNFFSEPNDNLIQWGQQLADYEQCFLFIMYLYEQFGGTGTIKSLVASEANGIAGLVEVLENKGFSISFEEIFSNWIVANHLRDTSFGNGEYGYSNIDLSSYAMLHAQDVDSYPHTGSGYVNAWAANYIGFTQGQPVDFAYNGPAGGVLIQIGAEKQIERFSTEKSLPEFGDQVDILIFVPQGFNSGGSYGYTVQPMDDFETELVIDPAQMSLGAQSQFAEFNLYSNVNWNVTANQSWLTVIPSSGNGNVVLEASCERNTSYEKRYAEISVTGGGKISKATVVQDAAIQATIAVSIPTTLTADALPGATFVLPVNVNENLTGKDVYAYGCTLSFDASRLEALGATHQECLASGWGEPSFGPGDGFIIIGAAGSDPLTGQGTLVKVDMRVKPSHSPADSESVPLVIQNFAFNEGNPGNTASNGLVTFRQQRSEIAGQIAYYIGDRNIESVQVDLTGHESAITTTNESGIYTFFDLPSGAGRNYTITPSMPRSGTLESAISPFDASFVLRSYVGSLTLTEYQKLAADVSGNQVVSPFDASYILRYYVGQDILSECDAARWLFVQPPVSDWTHPDKNRTYEPLNADEASQDFYGILLGDVSGNWATSPEPAKTNQGTISLGQARLLDGNILELLVLLDASGSCYSAGINLKLDPESMQLQKVEASTRPDPPLLVHNALPNGDVRIALAGSKAMGDGEIMTVFLKLASEDVEQASLVMSAYEIDGHLFEGIREELSWNSKKLSFELRRNYPNPFNPETRMIYVVARESDVNISVYNMLGQKVRELVNENKERGEFETIWDGRNGAGTDVPSGVYFVKYRAGDILKTQKIVKSK